MTFASEASLDAFLSHPSDADTAAMAQLEGTLLILGAGGKMGPSLALRARRSNPALAVTAVSRFQEGSLAARLNMEGIRTVACDLLQPGALATLPEADNVIFMAARKFGTTGSEHLTWAMNTFLPGLVAERYRDSRIVAFSTGNVYPFRPIVDGGAVESSPADPRRRVRAIGAGARAHVRIRLASVGHARCAILRLNYAIDLRYGVLLDIGREVFEQPAGRSAHGPRST